MDRRQLIGLSAGLLVSAGCLERTEGATNSTHPLTQSDTTTKTTESPTRTPDCRIPDLSIFNENVDTISVSIRIIQDEDASDTGRPKEVFSDSVRISPNDRHEYKELPNSRSTHRLEIDVEGGPTATEEVQAREWEQTSLIMVVIEEGSIEFSGGEYSRRSECSGTPQPPSSPYPYDNGSEVKEYF